MCGTDRVHRLERDALVGLVASTEHLTVAMVRLLPGRSSEPVVREGDVLVFVERGSLTVRATWAGETEGLALGRWDAAYLALGSTYTLEGAGDEPVDAVVGVAPSYLTSV